MNVTLHQTADRHALRFERRLAQPAAKVWRALTEPAELSAWFPADVDMELVPGGKVSFTFRSFGLADGELRQTPGGWTVRFERQLTRPVDEVWARLTGGGAVATGDPVPEAATPAGAWAGTVTVVAAPRLLEADDGQLAAELSGSGRGDWPERRRAELRERYAERLRSGSTR